MVDLNRNQVRVWNPKALVSFALESITGAEPVKKNGARLESQRPNILRPYGLPEPAALIGITVVDLNLNQVRAARVSRP